MATSLTAPQSGELVRASHVAPIAELLNGTANSDNIPVALINHSSSSNYSLRVRNQSTNTVAPAFKASVNTGGSETVILDATAQTVYAKNFATKGRAIYDIRAYGALSDGSDQTTAILAARSAILTDFALSTSLGGGYAGILFFPPGAYRMNQPLVFQSIYGVTIRGCGPNVSVLYTTDRVDNWAGLHQLDIANSSNMCIEYMDIRNDLATVASGSNLPDTGVFWAQGTGNGSNANRLDNCRIEGAYRYACFYNYAVPSSSVNEVDFYLRSSDPSAGVDNNTDAASCVILTRDNVMSLVASNSLTLQTPGQGSMSDIVFHECEFHDIVAQSRSVVYSTPTASANSQAIWLDEAYEIKVIGGNISAGSRRYVRLTGAANAAGGIGCRDIKFDGVTFYSEGATASIALFSLYVVELDTAPAGVSSPVTAVRNLAITDCYAAARGGTASASVIQGVQGSTFYQPTLKRWTTQATYTGAAFRIAGTGGTVEDADIDANSCPVIFGSAGFSTRGQRIHKATTTVTAASESHGAYMLSFGGAVSLAGGGTAYYGAGANATEANVAIPIAQSCRVRNLQLRTATAPGTSQTFSAVLMLNGASTAMTAVISNTSTANRNIATVINVGQGDTLSVKVVSSASAATTAAIVGTLSVWDT